MHKFGIFVDGSNLTGSLGKLNLKIPDYESFYKYVFREGASHWAQSFHSAQTRLDARLHRVMLYQLGEMDYLDFSDPKLQANQRELFDRSPEVKNHFMREAGIKLQNLQNDELHLEAWKMYWKDRENWYAKRKGILQGVLSFNHAVQESCDFLQVVPCGYWKLNILKSYIEEKGLDTGIAVGVATHAEFLDVILLMSGDADFIPSVDHAKTKQCSVGAIDIIRGSPPEKKGRQSSTRLHSACDFVVRVYETELLRLKLAETRTNDNGEV
ncbi:NYN domain-containing protein [Prosthecobacter vanneervenii]|uniref:Uncharacterized LabA/DUF88 family protein n=1 Tax=Prosthecobacter vanneervenii TaxID=48466 RepID=A0A7W7YBU3_9BACT|nr:NYN domain-containing protein [Prosthecobacter vanneervenii]MBB5033205.1 uncharacterized LabA/DUF88 family protein [Prosthecobacter vanneervenii]